MRELLTAAGRYKQLYDTQYRVERDRFINDGEDFTPDSAGFGCASVRRRRHG